MNGTEARKKKNMKELFPPRDISAYDAISEAQRLAFAPLVFQAVRSLRDLGVLEALEAAGKEGTTLPALEASLELGSYGVRTLVESGVSCGVVDALEDGHFALSKVGYFILHDPMTRINMDYTHDVCYQAAFDLKESIATEKPVGLRVFGEEWETVYQALTHLPEQVRKSWYRFDHYYSDAAYPEALEYVLEGGPASLVDIGANVGKFSLLAVRRSPELRVTMVDLPEQLEEACANVAEAGFEDRVDGVGMDVLQPDSALPPGRDRYWMSQLLSCFGRQEVVGFLARVAEAMTEDSVACILETCWDRQRHPASAYSLVNTSLYFTCVASGNSRMYSAEELEACFAEAGLEPVRTTDDIGICHTLFECRKAR
ncbi:MAG: SAM-dependent methyltransferase [Thiohalospira sp.]